MSIRQKIDAWFGDMHSQPHHRSWSWEHCYRYFQSITRKRLADHRESAAMQLGFFLASWGMYRGSSFLVRHAYTVHLDVVDVLAKPSLKVLWEREVGSDDDKAVSVSALLDAIDGIRKAYGQFGRPTDTLVTKVLLGTLGCLPACDRYFLLGFKSSGHQYSSLNRQFINRVLQFCSDNIVELREEQARIRREHRSHYPLMKLVDMYFHQVGNEQ